jgi:ribosome-associated protein
VNATSTLANDDDGTASGLISSQSDAPDDSRVRALVAAGAASAKNGEDIALLAVGDIISIIDYFVLVSASNTRLVRTIVDEVQLAMREHDGSRPIGVEGRDDATWVLLDYADVVVHVFLAETREFYDLDRLWADAPRVDVADDPAALRQASR